jgi:alkylation response protein AidB-like acyl-CoA dehydrogenase
LGDAQVHLDTARLVALNIAERVRDAGKTSAPLSIKDRVEINAMTAQVVRLSRAAIDLLNSMSGASSIQQDLPLQRIFRDMEGLALHAAMALNTNLEVFGRVLAGNDPGTPFF